MIQKNLLTPLELVPSDSGDSRGLKAFERTARGFLLAQSWCQRITQGYLGLGFPGILGVFLFEIIPSREGVDRALWVVTGDLPPAYLVCDEAPVPLDALRRYVLEMRRWVDAVRHGDPLDNLIPVNGAPTIANADELEGRLDFIESEILEKD